MVLFVMALAKIYAVYFWGCYRPDIKTRKVTASLLAMMTKLYSSKLRVIVV